MQWCIVKYIFFTAAPLPFTFKASSTKFTVTVARPKSDRSLINGMFFRLQITSKSLNDDRRKKVLMEFKWLIFTDTLR